MDQTITPDAPTPSPVADDAARSAWLQTGVMPGNSSAEKDADSAPAQPVEQAASTEVPSKADSEPAAPAKAIGAEARIPELLRDRAEERRLRLDAQARADDLERRLAALERPAPDAKPGSSPEGTTKAEWQRYAEMPEAPKEDAFERYGDYTAAMSLFIGKQLFAEHEQANQRRAQQQQTEQQIVQKFTKAHEAFNGYLKENPGAKDKIRPELLDITPISMLRPDEPAGPHHFIAEQVVESSVNGPLLEYFSTREGAEHWGRLMTQSPDAIVREIGRLEGRFLTRAAASTATPPKTVSTTPDPPETLGRRPADPVPDADAALARGDFAAYADAMNRRDWAAKRSA